MVNAQIVLEVGRSLAGENETVVGSNNTTVNRYYGWIGAAYCGGFIKYCMEMAGCTLLAVLLLVFLAFYWGRRTGHESARPWEITDYGDLDAAQMSWVIEGIQERIVDLEDRLDRAIKTQRQKSEAAGGIRRDITDPASARPPPPKNQNPDAQKRRDS